MTPEQAIVRLGEMTSKATELSAAIVARTNEIRDEWAGLCRAGGGRADHAALLLGKLSEPLADIGNWSQACQSQITDMVADPFRDEV
jgi:hypothetical protein